MTGGLSKNFHGVGIGPLSKILAVKSLPSNQFKGLRSKLCSEVCPNCHANLGNFRECATEDSNFLTLNKLFLATYFIYSLV